MKFLILTALILLVSGFEATPSPFDSNKEVDPKLIRPSEIHIEQTRIYRKRN